MSVSCLRSSPPFRFVSSVSRPCRARSLADTRCRSMLKDDRLYDPRRDFHAREKAAQESERLDAGGVAAALQQRAREVGRPNIEGLDGAGGGAEGGVVNDEELDWSM